jgi:hypothetical protein
MTFRRGPRRTTIYACAGLLTAGAPAAFVLLRDDAQEAQPAPGRVAIARARREPAPRVPPPESPAPGPQECGLLPAAGATAHGAARATALDDEAPDDDEALARRLLGERMIGWLGEEDDADAALIWAEKVGELARWLADEDRARLVTMARADAAEARRRAALAALGSVAAEDATYVGALAEAFLGRPTPEARLGVEDALATLRAKGRDARPLEEALLRAR